MLLPRTCVSSVMKISFCTTCFNRLPQLRQGGAKGSGFKFFSKFVTEIFARRYTQLFVKYLKPDPFRLGHRIRHSVHPTFHADGLRSRRSSQESRHDVFHRCYRTTREQPALGPMQTLPKPLPPGERAFVFGYLAADDARVEPLLTKLMKASVPCCMYIRQAPPGWQEMTEGSSVKLFDAPQKLPEALTAASAVLHHGGLSTTEIALAAGRPQLIFPRYLEQVLTADAVARMDCGMNLMRESGDPISAIQRALKGSKLRKSAEAAAERLGSTAPVDVAKLIPGRCHFHLK